jgi:hypothetical protein
MLERFAMLSHRFGERPGVAELNTAKTLGALKQPSHARGIRFGQAVHEPDDTVRPSTTSDLCRFARLAGSSKARRERVASPNERRRWRSVKLVVRRSARRLHPCPQSDFTFVLAFRRRSAFRFRPFSFISLNRPFVVRLA